MAKHEFNMSDEDLRKWIYSEYLLRAPKTAPTDSSESMLKHRLLTHEEMLLKMQDAFNWIKGETNG